MSEGSFLVLLLLAFFFGFGLPPVFSFFLRGRSESRRVADGLLILGAVLMTVGFVMMVVSLAGPARLATRGLTDAMLALYFAGLFLNSPISIVTGNLRLQTALAVCWILVGMLLAVFGSFSVAGTPPPRAGLSLFLTRVLVFGGGIWLLVLAAIGLRTLAKRREV
jgi:hypothetical protein